MDPEISKVVVAVVGGAGIVLGALAAGLANAFAALQKLQELTLQYRQKLHETYLVNARLRTNEVYLPLGIELERLRSAYDDFRIHIPPHESEELGPTIHEDLRLDVQAILIGYSTRRTAAQEAHYARPRIRSLDLNRSPESPC